MTDPLEALLVPHVPPAIAALGLELDPRYDAELKAWLRQIPEHLRHRLLTLMHQQTERAVAAALAKVARQ